jgi:hypothetical protein
MTLPSPAVLKTMPRREVLGIVRDVCARESARIRGLHETLIRTGDQTHIPAERLEVILALNAASDMASHVIAKALQARDPKRPAEWIVELADQACAALMNDGREEDECAEDKELADGHGI